MKMMKKSISALAAAAILAASSSFTAVFALERQNPYKTTNGDEYVFVDAAKDVAPYKSHDKTIQETSDGNWYSPTYDKQVYGISNYSYEWEPYKETRRLISSRAVDKDNLLDLTDYSYLKLRVYLPEFDTATTTKRRIALRIHSMMDCASSSATCGSNGFHCLRYDSLDLASYEAGWNEISIPFSSLVNKTKDSSHSSEDLLKAVDYVEIGTTGILSTIQDFAEGEMIYVDKIWVSKDAETDDIYMIEDYTDGAEQSWGGAYNACCTYNSNGAIYTIDSETTLNGANYSVRWNNLNGETAANGDNRERKALFALTKNELNGKNNESKVLKDYSYVNAWVYSHEKTEQNLVMRIYFDKASSGTASAGNCYLISNTIQVNWTGWKLVSVKISDMTNNANSKGDSYSWDNGDIKVYATGFQANNTNNCDKIDVNIDSIWYSKYDCSKMSLVSAFTNAGEIGTDVKVAPYDKTVGLQFSGTAFYGADGKMQDITVKAGENTLTSGVDYDVQLIGNTAYIQFSSDLEENTVYTVSVFGSDEDITFTTDSDYDIKWNGNVLSIANNTSKDLKDVKLFTAEYDTNGVLESVTVKDVNVSQRESKTFEANENSDKAFVFNKTLTPLCAVKVF